MTDHSNWSTQTEGGAPAAMRLMRWLALNVPRSLVSAVLWCVSLYFVSQPNRPTTRAATNYLTRLNGAPPDRRMLHRHARNFAEVAMDRPRLLHLGMAGADIHVRNSEPVHAALAKGRGGILLGAHFGSFEALRAFDRMLPGLNVRYLMYGEHAEASTRLLGELNPEVEARVIPLTDGPSAMLGVFDALMEGDFVAFLGDRQPEEALGAGIDLQFLGSPIRVPTSPYITAMAAKVPLILCFAPRLLSGRYLIEFLMLYDGSPVPRHQRDAKCRELAERYVEHLQGLCRRHPDNWFNFFDIWGDGVHRVDPERGNHAGAARQS